MLTTNRGGLTGIHGFIGETTQVHVSNIKAFIEGNEPLYILLDDNSMTDYVRGMQLIQQKACKAGGYLGLDAVKRHMEKYPEFVRDGGIYQIPRDMYERYIDLKNLPSDVAMKLRKEDLQLWKYIDEFSKQNPDAVIEPMEISYADIQAGNIEETINNVTESTNKEFEKQRQMAHKEYAPTFEEFLRICGISAVIEGSVGAGIEFVHKLRDKKISELTKKDAKDVFFKFVTGCGKGAFRGGFVYVATNIYKAHAALASGLVTAVNGIIHEAYSYMKKQCSRAELVKNSLFIAFETSVSTVCAVLGKYILKKHPIIGALGGSILGSACAGYVRRVIYA